MRRFALSWVVLLMAAPGCGLALDYDPPTDTGPDARGLDAPGRDALSDGGTPCVPDCDPGSVCLDGACLHTCDATAPCHFDDAVCETCDLARGVCVPSDAACAGGCFESCNGMTDACEPNCPVGQNCLGGSCSNRVPCSADGDCTQVNRCGQPAVCGPGGFCEDVTIAPCPPYDCATTDDCMGCAVTHAPAMCTGATPFCDEASGLYRCVECLRNPDCTDPGLPVCDNSSGQCAPCTSDRHCMGSPGGPHCDPAIGACVPCTLDEHCLSTSAPFCDVSTHQCVPCLVTPDCGPGQICRPDHTCGGCIAPADCGPWATCMGGACRPRSCPAGGCPLAPCATVSCDAGLCVYTPAAIATTLCNDGMRCTGASCAPLDPRADSNGCVHNARTDRCSDSVDCTVDLCLGTRFSPIDGCIHRPNPASCGGPTDCRRYLCLPRGVATDIGCQAQYFPDLCAPGEICATDGACVAVSGCDACDDDGFACNGTETCETGTGTCTQTLGGASGCNGGCNTYCVGDATCRMVGPVPLPCLP